MYGLGPRRRSLFTFVLAVVLSFYCSCPTLYADGESEEKNFAEKTDKINAPIVFYLEALDSYRYFPPTAGNIQRQIVLLKAQSRLTPNWELPWRLLYGIYRALGKTDEAIECIQKLLSLEPRNSYLQLQYIETFASRYQVLEAKEEYYRSLLSNPELNPDVQGYVNLKLAELSYEQYDWDSMRRYLDIAVRRCPYCLRAYDLYNELVVYDKGRNYSVDFILGLQIRRCVAQLELNPFDITAAIELARISSELNYPEGLDVWRDYIFKMAAKVGGDNYKLPKDVVFALAEAYINVGLGSKADELLELVRPLITSSTGPSIGGMTDTGIYSGNNISDVVKFLMLKALAEECKKLEGSAGSVDERFSLLRVSNRYVEELGKLVDSREHLESLSPDLISKVAIFYYLNVSDLSRAARLAELAYKKDSNSVLASLAYALILVDVGQVSKAEELVSRISASDNEPLYRLFMAKLKIASGEDRKKTLSFIEDSLRTVLYGIVRIKLNSLAAEYGIKGIMPNIDDSMEAIKVSVYKANRLVELSTDKLIDVNFNIVSDFSEGDIPQVVVSIKNISGVDLIIGDGGFISPYMDIVVGCGEDKEKGHLRIHFNGNRILPSDSKGITIKEPFWPIVSDVSQNKTFEDFISRLSSDIKFLDAEAEVSGIAYLPDARIVRIWKSRSIRCILPELSNQIAAMVLFKLNEADLPRDKIWNFARLVRLVLLRQDLLDYRDKIVDAIAKEIVRQTDPYILAPLVWACGHEDAIKNIKKEYLDNLFNALGRAVANKDWVVRLLAVDSIGGLQGSKARRLFEHLSEKDPYDLVRQLATAYLLLD